MRVLYVAEIVGKSGVFCVKSALPALKKRYEADFVIANANSATGGNGLGKRHAHYLHKLGCDVLTAGDAIFSKPDLTESLGETPFVLRAANFPKHSPGFGWRVFDCDSGEKIAVISLLGRFGISRALADNPFFALDHSLAKFDKNVKNIFVDFHAQSTAEKCAFAKYADGKVSAVLGSHSRVQTADERIFQKGTAAISDCGRTGAVNSVGGMDAKNAICEYLTQIPRWPLDAEINAETSQQLQGVFVETNPDGKAKSIERIKLDVKL